jgi:hypothetical protein
MNVVPPIGTSEFHFYCDADYPLRENMSIPSLLEPLEPFFDTLILGNV